MTYENFQSELSVSDSYNFISNAILIGLAAYCILKSRVFFFYIAVPFK